MKKILFILNSLTFGGAERQIIDVINNIDRTHFDVSVLYLDSAHDLLPQIDETKLKSLRCLERSKKFDIGVLKRLHRYITLHNIETVFCVNEYPFLYAFLCKKIWKHNYRLIAGLHTTNLEPRTWISIKHALYRRILNRCDSICFVCGNQMDYWIENFGIRKDISTYIYNGINTSYFSDPFSIEEKVDFRKKLGLTPDVFVIGICAVLRPEKKHVDFIAAIIEANQKGFSIKGLIIGDGPERKSIDNLIQKHSLQDDILVTGFQNDVRPYISLCDCMVLTSHSVETFSIAALESMAIGKPVVMTNIGGASEQVDNGVNGFLYDPGDINALSNALMVIAKPGVAQMMGEKARKIVHTQFGISQMVKKYEDFLG